MTLPTHATSLPTHAHTDMWLLSCYRRARRLWHVLDAELHPCPAWVGNELYIGGIGLAHGYVGDAAKTAASFIVHPRTRERLYRTGDLGRWQADGEVEFLGRADFQVKIAGAIHF